MSSPTTPTTQQVSDNIIAQLEAAMNNTVPLLPKVFQRVLAKALAGVFIILYKYADYIFKQLFVQTCSASDTTILGVTVNPLKFWGNLIGVGDPTEATQAGLLIDIPVTNQTGSLAAYSQLVGSGNGVTYVTLAAVALDAATVQATVRAVADQAGGNGAGVIGNLDAGAVLTFANPIPNVATEATVDSQVVTAANAEATEVYRQRVLDRFQKRPQGGAYADYQIWGESVAGIVNVYPYTGDPGQVDLYSEATVASSGSADGIPTGAQLQAVYDAVQLDENGLAKRRPAGAFVNSYAITRTGFDIKVTGIADVDDVATVRADIEADVAAFFTSMEPFITGLSLPPRQDIVTATKIAGIVEDVVTAAGGTFTAATFSLTGSPTAISTYILGEGEKAKFVAATWV